MTHVEAKEVLKTRVEWKKPLDSRFTFLEFDAPESGRNLHEEHSSVNIPIIYELLVDNDIENDAFLEFLLEFKETAILQMLHDVFMGVKEIESLWISDNTGLFDYAIILKLTINTISRILNSTKINMQKVVTTDNLKRYYIDLNGLKDRDNGVFVSGFVERYRKEIDRIKQVLFLKNRRLKVTTAR